jgi:DNA adenine methylase
MPRMSRETSDEEELLQEPPAVPLNLEPRPFVKWAGGKGQLLKDLDRFFPRRFSTYYEPFLGAGAVFFHLVKKSPPFRAILSDVNEELISAYRVVKESVEDLIKLLEFHKSSYSRAPKKYFYKVRDMEPSNAVERAGRLIFLNKTCYNGLYRVNRKGKFNVPFGEYKNPQIYEPENLRTVSQVLRISKVELLAVDYQKATEDVEKKDFIYLDPPYHPASSTASFTGYTDSGFSFEEQKRLGKWFRELDKRRCKILLSNSDTKEVRDIYEGYHIKIVAATRAISCRGEKRTGHTELIICNYEKKQR